MQCKYCNKQSYIAHICPYCKEYYCLEHREPKAHNCPSYQQSHQPATRPKPTMIKPEKPQMPLTTIANIQKNFFATAFALVLLEEILRLISYMKYSPFLEPNIYVAIASQWLTPYLASAIIFLITCFILFVTKKFAKNQNGNNPYINLLKKAIPLGIYTVITIIYIFSITNWLLILLR